MTGRIGGPAWGVLLLLGGCGGGEAADASTGAEASAGSEASAGESGGAGPTCPGGEASCGPTMSASTAGDPTSGAPETTDPGSAGPDTSGPDTSGPDTSGPDTSGPDTSGDPTGDPGGDPTGDPTGDPLACDGATHQGQATYYDADGSGNCSFPADPGDPLVAAMNDADYAQSAACGACVAIDGPDGSTTVRVVDRCPECPQGNLDLHPGAFAMLADPQLGVVPISWRYVPCPVDGDIVYHFKEGSNQWWTAVQVRGHRNAIASFEYKDAMGAWKPVARVDYNFFIDMNGMGPGPYSFRVTDVLGNVLEDEGVPFVEAGDSPGAGQFPACAP